MGWGLGGERLFEFDWEEEGVGANSRLDAYSNKYGILMSLDGLRFKYNERKLKEIHLSLYGHLWTFKVICRFGSG